MYINKLPFVTIITPAYNHAPWISTCIESVQQQSYSNWEQIIIDDGSKDDTLKVVAPYLTDTRVKYIHQENQGIWNLGNLYNTALQMSNGELVAILEGDDFWVPERLAIQVPVFEDHTIGLSYGRVLTADSNGQIVSEDTKHRNKWQPPRASFNSSSPLPFLRDLLMLRGNVGAVSVMFRRSVLLSVGGFWQPSYFPAVDFTTLLRVATEARTSFLDQPLGYWRRHAGQTTDIRALEYALGHTQAAVEYYLSLPESIRTELGITEANILQSRQHYITDAYWGATRTAMRNGSWSSARLYALQMLRWGNTLRRLEGLISFFAALIHLNIEPSIEWLAQAPIGKMLVHQD